MLKQLEEMLDLFFGKKLPALPKNIKEIIVVYIPWGALIGLILEIPMFVILVLFMLGLGAFGFTHITHIILAILLGTVFAFTIMAIPGLFKRTKKGWYFSYYAILVAIVYWIGMLDFVESLITALLGFYILFQIKEYYS